MYEYSSLARLISARHEPSLVCIRADGNYLDATFKGNSIARVLNDMSKIKVVIIVCIAACSAFVVGSRNNKVGRANNATPMH